MSARSSRRNALLAVALGVAGTALAADSPEPDMELLEYLGLWGETDEEWLLVEYQMSVESEERIDPAPEGEESTEDDDES
jgi:hypothetical protein